MSDPRPKKPTIRTSTCPLGGAFEQLLLLSTIRLGEKAYARTIFEDIGQRTQRRVSLRAVYETLARLEERGLIVRSMQRWPIPMRTRNRHTWRMTVHGRRAVRLALRNSDRMRRGLPGLEHAEPLPPDAAKWWYGRVR